MKVLDIRTLLKGFDGLQAVQDVTMGSEEGERRAVIGPSGTGKTILISSVIGFRPIQSGSILLDGKEIGSLSAHRIVRLGMGLVPQGRRIFSSLTVIENLEVPHRNLCKTEETMT